MSERAQRRIQAAIPIFVSGTDSMGMEFNDSVEAQEVSRRGLSFLTHRELKVLDKVSVIVPGRGPSRAGEGPTDFYSEASVVRITPAGDSYHVALRFIGATLPVYSPEAS